MHITVYLYFGTVQSHAFTRLLTTDVNLICGIYTDWFFCLREHDLFISCNCFELAFSTFEYSYIVSFDFLFQLFLCLAFRYFRLSLLILIFSFCSYAVLLHHFPMLWRWLGDHKHVIPVVVNMICLSNLFVINQDSVF